MDRRKFVQASLSSLAAAGLLGEIPALGQTPPARKDVTSSGASGDLNDYRNAVAGMRSRPASDRLSWEYWAKIHNDYCPHTNWWFLPWHRVYLYYFEQVCQTILNKPAFRLPYWNWSANNNIPGPFQDRNSPLYDSTRQSNTVAREAVNQQLIDDLVRSGSELDLFSGAANTQRGGGRTGRLEGTPHNTVHRNIGGNMATLFSPRDPIFWLHHCNIDRIWASWQRVPGHNSPSLAPWGQLTLTGYYDPVNRRDASAVTSSVPTGQYVIPYDRYISVSAPVGSNLQFREFGLAGAAAFKAVPGHEISGAASNVKPVALGSGETVSISLGGLQNFTPQSFRAAAAPAAAAHASVSESYLLIEDIPWPSDPNVSLRVFLNADHPTPATPVTDPAYVGTISFFGMPMKNTFALGLTEAMARKLSGGSTTVEVGLVAVDLLHPERVSSEATIRPASLRIVALNENL